MYNYAKHLLFIVAIALLPSCTLPDRAADVAARYVPNAQTERQVFMIKPIVGGMPLGGGGTGFMLNDSGKNGLGRVVVTNKHVCEAGGGGATKFLLIQNKLVYVGRLVALSEKTDLCLIAAPKELKRSIAGLEAAPREAQPFEHVSAVGHPYLRPLTRTPGEALNIFIDIDEAAGEPMRIGVIDFIISPGNSGSPLLNSNDEVVGVVFAIDLRTYNGLYIPLEDLKAFLAEVRARTLTK